MAASSAHITSLEVLAILKEACAQFKQVATEAIVTMDGDFRRGVDQLHQMLNYWQAQIKKQEENLATAKIALNRKKLARMFGSKIDATVEEEEFRKAKRRLEFAQEKVVQVKKWIPRLEKAEINYSGGRQMLMNMIETDLLKGMNFLENKLLALEAYLRVIAPEQGKPPTS